MRRDAPTGAFAILLAIAFNLPYLWLAAHFDYPGILRAPTDTVLAKFVEGGPALVLAWWLFGLCALAQTALAAALLRQRPLDALGVAAAMTGALAGLVQAMGLWRWAFAVPAIADAWQSAPSDLKPAIALQFEVLHQFGGVAIGEHLGQWLTAAWVLLWTLEERRHARRPVVTALGLATVVGIVAGALEGLTTVLHIDPGPIAWGAPIGYGVFTAWLIAIGVLRLRANPHPRVS